MNLLALHSTMWAALEINRYGSARIKIAPNMLLLGLFACILMSHITHMNLSGMLTSCSSFFPNMLLFVLLVNTLVNERRLKITVWVIVILTFILGIEGIHQYYRGYGWAMQEPFFDSGRGEFRIRWIGIFNDPNDLALLYVVGASFLVSFIFSKTTFVLKLVSAAFLVVIGRALYYTNSRGGFLAMAASVAVCFFLRMKNKILALIVGGLLAFCVVIVGPSRMSQISASEASAHGRIDAWHEGFQMLKRRPLFGVGYDMFSDYHEIVAHNSYISVAAELGIVGLYFWMGLIYVSITGSYKVVKQEPSLSPYVHGAMTGLFGFLAASYFLSRDCSPVLYIMLALNCSFMHTFLKQTDLELGKSDYRNIAFTTLGILTVVWLSVKLSLNM